MRAIVQQDECRDTQHSIIPISCAHHAGTGNRRSCDDPKRCRILAYSAIDGIQELLLSCLDVELGDRGSLAPPTPELDLWKSRLASAGGALTCCQWRSATVVFSPPNLFLVARAPVSCPLAQLACRVLDPLAD